MGAHGHRREGPASRRELRVGLAVVLVVGIATLGAMIWMWPSGVPSTGEPPLPQVDGAIIELDREPCPEALPDEVNGCGSAVVRLTDGPDAGSSVQVALPNGTGAPEVEAGDDVVLVRSTTPDGESYSIVDHQRATGLWMVAAAFALALVTFGRWRGVTALAGLGVTFAVLVFFVVPAIVAGEPPLLVAIVGSAAIMLTVLYLTHGFGAATTVAVLGTLISLTLTGLLSAASVAALHLTGVTDDLSAAVGTTQQVNTQGLLLAGIVIGSLGVLDDVTVTQAVTVTELARANPLSRAGELYRAGSRVGRAHIASVVNTVVLAYAGSSLPLLILVVTAGDTLRDVVTDQVIAQEIVRSAVATLGLVAAVPVTTGLAALVAAGEKGSRSA
ncbi:YibE/F family protein [Nocardioides astragali]|uniref:YibE/F family protein n=1 Tax=Nocardioides astragali TaxID=1776736 RepID=A0ABW2NBK6_9ACTN|nr:YibE/F family protein [Nocardioides astragali]